MTSKEVVVQAGSVTGTISDPDCRPVAGVTVTVAARRLRSEAPLGESVTGADGRYRVDYAAAGGSVGVVVRAAHNGGPTVESSREPAGNGEVVIDLNLPVDRRTEYATVRAAVTPLLDGATISALGAPDVVPLAAATGRSPEQIEDLATATRHAAATGLSAELFYGALRQGMPRDLADFSARPAAEIDAAVAAASAANLIETPGDEAAEFATVLRAEQVRATVDPAANVPMSPVGELFAAAVTEPDARQRMYAAYLDGAGDALPAESVPDPHAERLRRAFELRALIGHNPPLLRELLTRFDSGEFAHLRDLVRLDGGWPELIEQTNGVPQPLRASLSGGDTSPAPSDADHVTRYADTVRSKIIETYPTAHVAYELSARPEHAETAASRFLTENPEFEIISTPVNSATVPDEHARIELGEIQRTFKLTRRFGTMQSLRDNGFGSSFAVARLARDTFASQVSDDIGEADAHAIHAKATEVHAAAVNVIADYRTAAHFDVPWLPSFAPADPAAPHPIPNWEELFGSVDYGTFDDAHSVYGEAAYLVDLLYFLRRLGGGDDRHEGAVADVLYARRGDLVDVDLSIDNTTLELPCVDLINELLESAVAPATAIPPAQRQSSGDAAALRIQPQHVNNGAYDTLRTAVYPWDLPYDLWRDQTGAALANLGVTRMSLLETVGAAADSPTLRADERLGLGTVAARIIAGEPLTPARTLADCYGKPPATDLSTVLSTVRTLLDTGSLRYAELTELLDTRFVNPGAALSIKADEKSPYDTNKMTLVGLDHGALDRLHRFVRLQRALGWSATTLDRAIFGSNSRGNLDRETLRTLGALRTLAARLDLSVDQVLTFYNTVETHSYRTDAEPPLYDRMFLDPSVVTTAPGARNPFALRADRAELSVLGDITDPTVTAALLAVLQLTDEDLAALTTGTRAVIPNRVVNLANLSALVRTVTLASALSLSIPDLLRLIELYGGGGPFPILVGVFARETVEHEVLGGAPMLPTVGLPFPAFAAGIEGEVSGGAPMRPPGLLDSAPSTPIYAQTVVTEQFLDAVAAIQDAGFTVPEVDAVLTATLPPQGGVIPDDETLAGLLTVLRSALRVVYQETAQTLDERGDLTKKHLAQLGWEPALAQDAAATLLGTVTYTAQVAALPDDVVFPPKVPIRFHRDDQLLVFAGPMNDAQRIELRAVLPSDAAYLGAVEELYDAPRRFVRTRMKALRIPVYAAPLPQLPVGYEVPKALASKVFYDINEHALKSRGYLSQAEAEALTAAPGGAGLATAVATLRTVQERPLPAGDSNTFLTSTDAIGFFQDDMLGPAGRFRIVLSKLNPLLRRTLSEITIKQQIGQATGLDAATADQLLGQWLRPTPSSAVLEDFLAHSYVSSDPAVSATRTAFGQQFSSLARIHRVALVSAKLGITALELPALFRYADRVGWLDLNDLPSTQIVGPAPLFGRFIRLLDLIRLRNATPGRNQTLALLWEAAGRRQATTAEVVTVLAARTGWNATDLAGLAEWLGLDTGASFLDVGAMTTLNTAVRMLRRIGVTADRLGSWLRAELTPEAAQGAWQAAKAQHALRDWPAVAAPMQDAIREHQRNALVSYLVANPLRTGNGTPQWRDAYGLHDYFLLDVDMGAAQLTTRIAQAIYSVQLFVQRIQLDLEPSVTIASPGDLGVWEWMKQYRLWEANQKVFLYPENYFEPDLRLDKTPFFGQFENELMQQESGSGSGEAAIGGYLKQLEEVSRLHPCGTYYDKDTNVFYVFARTESSPRSYFFRSCQLIYRAGGAGWTPWQQVDLDIDTDSVLPVVWHKRLYLFWLTSTYEGAPVEFDMPAPGDKMRDSRRVMKVQLNWSSFVNGAWQAKKTAKEQLSVTHDPYSFVDELQQYQAYVIPDNAAGDLVFAVVYREKPETESRPVRMRGWFRVDARETVNARGMTTIPLGSFPLQTPIPDRPAFGTVYNEFYLAGPEFTTINTLDPRSPLTLTVWRKTPPNRQRRLLHPHQEWIGDMNEMWKNVLFYTDDKRIYMLQAHVEFIFDFHFVIQPLYHPHVQAFAGQFGSAGLPGLFRRELQTKPELYTGPFDFVAEYDPEYSNIGGELPIETVEFNLADPYAPYNWELFFHAPLLIAERLSTDRKFEEAQQWFHTIFDPLDTSNEPVPQRFWRTKPFFQTAGDPSKPDSGYYQQRIEEVLRRVAQGTGEYNSVGRWLRNPFQPDVVAQLRTTAYQKAVVMKYLDNLIAWGDQLFRQDTGESINQAAQLYILAAELLGRRPEEVTDPTPPPIKSFRALATRNRSVSPVVAAESLIPLSNSTEAPTTSAITIGAGMAWYNYFHIPRNEKLLGYWDLVDDRLSKIRSGRTIDGVARKLPAFGNVIDPNLLVRAVAAGLDLSSVLDDINAPLPHYRFGPMLAKAKELAGEVKAFGAELLAALEKRDAEALARLRAGHETAILDAARDVRVHQVSEANQALAALEKSKQLAEHKKKYYSEREFMNDGERTHRSLTTTSMVVQGVSGLFQASAAVAALFPDAKVGPPPTTGVTFGGSQISNSLSHAAGAIGTAAGILSAGAGLAATMGGYYRRGEDWAFQAGQADIEIAQYDRQVAAATLRNEVADAELANHDKQRDQAREVDQFLRGKYTNRELYDWLAGQLSTSFFQTYQLAYDVAKRAERSYRHELGTEDSNFVKFGYWDSLHKGLLSGERLVADLHRMDAAFLDANARELELSKRISLAQLDGRALLALKETGRCYVTLPEALFDLDTPGHYFRRIKSLSVTVPCVAGPYTTVNLTATLTRSSVRVDPRLPEGKYARKRPGPDIRFRDFTGPVQSIVTSTGQDDTGLFETNLHDERFLPFEGAGAISEWQLSLPDEFRQFDYESITDVVLHLRYTARDGGIALGDKASAELRKAVNEWVHTGGGAGMLRVFSARREFADQWQRFLATPAAGTAKATFALSKSRFPQLFRDERFSVSKPELVLVLSQDLGPDGSTRLVDYYREGEPLIATLAAGTGRPAAKLLADPTLAGMPRAGFPSITAEVEDAAQDWVVTVALAGLDPHLRSTDGRLDPDAVLDLLLVCPFTVKGKN
ncbi:Tc toxin subunit A-related protein [Nocardia suismassiliense]|uniref:Tc toxin subunit A-related protein n=1 Tax=Nocardia suismassiliense TaxID=2077092 RepID=UPI0018FE7036|nr:neuraminidase-like domain-containing protein [Nocardia suismassiliense]